MFSLIPFEMPNGMGEELHLFPTIKPTKLSTVQFQLTEVKEKQEPIIRILEKSVTVKHICAPTIV